MPPPTRRSATTRALRHALARHRRLLTTGLLAAALAATLNTLAPPPPATTPVWAAARDLPAGHRLADEDLVLSRWLKGTVPDGTITVGSGTGPGDVLAVPLRRGEPLTDVRLVGPALLVGQPPGTVAVPVRPADPAVPALLRPGYRVDVVAGGAVSPPLADTPAVAPGTVLVQDSVVLAVPGTSGDPEARATPWDRGTDPAETGGVVVLALPVDTARDLTAAVGQVALGVTLRSPTP